MVMIVLLRVNVTGNVGVYGVNVFTDNSNLLAPYPEDF